MTTMENEKKSLTDQVVSVFKQMELTDGQWSICIDIIPILVRAESTTPQPVLDVSVDYGERLDEMEERASNTAEKVDAELSEMSRNIQKLIDEREVAREAGNRLGVSFTSKLDDLTAQVDLIRAKTTSVVVQTTPKKNVQPTKDYLSPPVKSTHGGGKESVAEAIVFLMNASSGKRNELITKEAVKKRAINQGTTLSDTSLDIYILNMLKAIAWKWVRLYNFKSRVGLIPVKHNGDRKPPNAKQMVAAYNAYMKRNGK